MAAAAVAGMMLVAPSGGVVAAPVGDRDDVAPPGANSWSCRSAAHPRPVILVHGTTANQNQNWHTLSPALAVAGYCVYTVTLGALPGLPGIGGLDRLSVSTRQLAAFVDKVMVRTGAKQVDFLGHSQGATLQLRYLRDYDAVARAHRVISLAGPISGPSRVGGLDQILRAVPPQVLGAACPACRDLGDPSNYRFTNYPTIRYVNIASRTDEVVNPPSVAFMTPAPNVRNVLLQSYCPGLKVGHDGMSKNPTVRQIILNELDPEHRRPVRCG